MQLFSELARYQGNESLLEAVQMSIISSVAGTPLHLHAQGLRGTGKTTILRAAAQVMPKIARIKGCLYNCDPTAPHCPEHFQLSPEDIAELGTEQVPMPFLEVSHSAKIGTVAGSIDLARITDKANPEAALLPGIIPQAHRGIIFIDEINRLADTSPEITDILLDAMGTKPGRVQIEETGLAAVEVPVQVSVWAASNPDEEPGPLSDIRKQLSDRFDLVMDMGRPDNAASIKAILRQHRAQAAASTNRPLADRRNNQVQQNLLLAGKDLREVWLPEYVENLLAEVYVKFGLESLRAVEAIQQAALARTGLQRKKHVEVYDVAAVLPWALSHRADQDTIQNILNYLNDERFVTTKDANNDSGDKEKTGFSRIFSGTKRAQASSSEPVPPKRARRLTELTPEEAIASEGDF